MKLYELAGCPYCAMVKTKLAQLGIAYESIPVPAQRNARKDVIEVSGQPFVPVLVDGETVLDDENDIIAYLDRQYAN